MANRVIYQSDALFISSGANSTGANQHVQLRRVQSANYSLNVSRQDVNQYGQLARIDSLILEAPTVSFDTSYYLGDGYNEMALGFKNGTTLTGVGFISGQITSTSGNNLYILTSPEGIDVNFDVPGATASTGYSTIGVGNAFLTDYSLDASVGDIPTVSVSFEGSNMNGTAGVSGSGSNGFSGISGVGVDPEDGTPLTAQNAGIKLPAASQGTGAAIPTALRPGDIELSISGASSKTIIDISGDGTAHVQSVSLSIPMSRTPIDKLGSKFAFARTVDFPITPTLNVSAIVSETQTKALSSLVASDDAIDSVQITFKDGATPRAAYKMTKLKLESESYSSSIGPNKSVDLTFSLSIGGPNDNVNNVFFSGSNSAAVLGNTRSTA
jgi:hypothetical protein